MHNEIIQAFKYNQPIDEFSQLDADYGRIETRTCRILPASKIIDTDRCIKGEEGLCRAEFIVYTEVGFADNKTA